ncbi:MAG: haloalkane dehalogenase, partial [Acidimicrobiales bacterium]
MIIRTPDSRFVGLPEFDPEPRYATLPFGSETVHMAYIEQGQPDAPPVVMLHGEPSWSFLYRRMIPIVVAAGMRVVVPDLIGFGRSDKPSEVSDYTYARHVEWTRALLFDALELDDVTLFCQDWGGLIGLRLVAEHPERFARVCAANTGLPDGTRRLPDAWWAFRDFVATADELPVGTIVSSGVVEPMSADVLAAYDAPFHTEASKAGVRAFPDLIPQTPDNPATPDNQAAWRSLEQFTRPVLC